MAATFVDEFGTFSQLPDFLHHLKLSPAAKHTYAILAGFQTFMGEAYVCREKIREKLGLALTTISTAVTELEQHRLVKRTGKFKYGSYPIVQVFCGSEAGVSKCQHLCKQSLTEELATANAQLEQEDISEKQTASNVCSSKNLDPEKLTLLESLRSFGVGRNAAKELITRYGLERVRYQIEHLEQLKKRGHDIANPAGWLMKAIRKRYQQPKEVEQTPNSINADEKTEQHRKAQYLLQKAQQEYRLDNLELAKTLAQESIDVAASSQAKELIAEIEKRFEKQKSREEILKAIPQEVFERVLQQKREEQKTILMKIGITKLGVIGEKAAYEDAVHEVMANHLRP